MPAMTFGHMKQIVTDELKRVSGHPADASKQLLADALEACLSLASQTNRLKEVNADLRDRLRNEQRLKEVVTDLRERLTEAEEWEACGMDRH